jgi:hypothetical protein
MASKGSCIKYGYQTYVPFSQNNTLDALCKEMKDASNFTIWLADLIK